jgi:dinuclear metal center YbgI/SA1388 family protein
MECYELEKLLNIYLNVPLFKDSCPNGLQVEGKREIKKIATAVSANLTTLQKAVEQEIDALVVHHGLFWFKDPYPLVGTKKNKIEMLLRHGIALFAYHLPLDAHSEVGNNWCAARELGWLNLEPFGEFNGTSVGVKGTFPAQEVLKFQGKLEAYYGHPAAVALGGKKEISSGSLISGGAYKELGAAARAGVDCFITGNFDEPAWSIAHEEGIHFFALGHAATEKVGPKALASYIQKTYGIAAHFLDVPNPF